MQLLLVRHAIAEDRDAFAQTGRDDSERPLTKAGRRRMQRAARGLHSLVRRIDLLATSPFARAAQTAAILAEEYGGPEPTEMEELTPGGTYTDFLAWLRTQASRDLVAAVGHDPHLPGLASLLLAGRSELILVMKKGGACLLEFSAGEREGTHDAGALMPVEVGGAGRAKLLWLLTPAQLRRVGR